MIFSKNKTILVFFVFLLFFSLFALPAQESSSKQASPVVDETQLTFNTNTSVPGAKLPSSPNSIWVLLRIVIVLAIVCVGIYGVVYLLKKTTKVNAGNDPYLKNVAVLHLSSNKSVRVVSIGTQAFVLGVCDQSISLISEITDKELIDTMNLESDRNSPVPTGTFTSVLKSFLPKQLSDLIPVVKPKTTESPPVSESTSALATTDFLKKQRDRLKNGSPE